MTLPLLPDAAEGRLHPVSQVMEEIAAIFADMGFDVIEGPILKASSTISPRLTFPTRIRHGKCTTHFI